MYALDYDGVIANTGALISRWVRDNMDLDIPSYRCDWTQLSPITGQERYYELGKFAYGPEGSAIAEPVDGAIDALHALAAAGSLYLITARNEKQTEDTRAWLDKRGLTDLFADIISQGDRPKVDTANELGCRVLVDDDQRHLISGALPKLILFRPGMGEPAHQVDGHTVCCSWPDALECALAAL